MATKYTINQLRKQLEDLGINTKNLKLKADFEAALSKALSSSSLSSAKSELITNNPKLYEVSTTLSEAEQELITTNPELYEAARPFISQMPDFRPQATVLQMKKIKTSTGAEIIEPQNNWLLLANELRNIGRKGEDGEKDRTFLENLQSGDWSNIRALLNDSYAKYFSITYPALTWLLSIPAINENLEAFAYYLIAAGLPQYVSWKKLLNINADLKIFIQAISDMETAKTMSTLPYFKDIEADIYSGAGGVWWNIVTKQNWFENIEAFFLFNQSIVNINLIDIVKTMLNAGFNPPGGYDNIDILLNAYNGWNNGKRGSEVVTLLLKYKRLNFKNSRILISASKLEDIELVKILLLDDRIDPMLNNGAALQNAVIGENIELIKLLLTKISPSVVDLETLVKGTQYDVLRLLLSDPRTVISKNVLNSVIRYNSDMILDFLASPVLDPNIVDPALLLSRPEILRLFLSHPKIDPLKQATLFHFLSSAESLRVLLRDKRIPIPAKLDINKLIWEPIITRKLYDHLYIILEDGRFDPRDYYSYPLSLAIKLKDRLAINILLEDGRIKPNTHESASLRELRIPIKL